MARQIKLVEVLVRASTAVVLLVNALVPILNASASSISPENNNSRPVAPVNNINKPETFAHPSGRKGERTNSNRSSASSASPDQSGGPVLYIPPFSIYSQGWAAVDSSSITIGPNNSADVSAKAYIKCHNTYPYSQYNVGGLCRLDLYVVNQGEAGTVYYAFGAYDDGGANHYAMIDYWGDSFTNLDWVKTGSIWLGAGSTGEAQITFAAYTPIIFQQTWSGHAIWRFSKNPIFGIDDDSVLNSSCKDSQFSARPSSQGKCGDPINTRTGTFSENFTDLSIPTSVGILSFERSYSSGATNKYSMPLGYGWTDSLTVKLIFPGSPGGRAGFVGFHSPLGNRFLFNIGANNTFSPAPGVTASLTESTVSPVTYIVTTAGQNKYIFDANGKLISQENPQGYAFSYTYNAQGQLTTVSADSGTCYLQIAYDSNGRISSVGDQTGRHVFYTYNTSGDLATYIDVFNKTWIYFYDNDHHLTGVKDPNGNNVVKTDYDTLGRAIHQYDGLNNTTVSIQYNPDGTSTISDALGHQRLDIYNAEGLLNGQTDPINGTTTKVYNSNFNPISVTDPSGHTASLTWSTDGSNMTHAVDAAGNQVNITYDTVNHPISVVDPRGFLTTYTYSGNHLTSVTDGVNKTTTYTYTPEGFLASVTDPFNHTTSYTYDIHGQRLTMTNPLGKTWTYTYDSLGRLATTTDPLNRVTQYQYDAAGRMTSLTRNYDPNHPQNYLGQYNIVTIVQYDVRGQQITITDTLGRITHYTYNPAEQVTGMTDPASNSSINSYDQAGRVTAVTDPLERVTHYGYDAANRLLSTTDPLNHSTQSSYNPDGTVATTTDPLGHVTHYTYNPLKRVTTVTDPASGVTHYDYDASGNLITLTDANGNATHYEYDALGHLTKQTDALGAVTEYFYDDAGNQLQTIDPNGNHMTYGYDHSNQLVTVTDELGNVTHYEYDDAGRRSAMIDARGKRTSYSYDALDKVVSVTDPLNHTTTTTYDAAGNLTSRTDPNNKTTSYSYDVLNQLIQATDPLNGSTTYTYDLMGNPLSTTDPNGNTTQTGYDPLNRPTSVTDANGNTTTRDYDAAGSITSVTDGLGNTATYTYDLLNRKASVTDPNGHVTYLGYEAVGHQVSEINPKGVYTRDGYDALGHLTAVTENYRTGFPADAQTNVRTEYTYDANGNRLSIKDGNEHTTSYTYDVLNRPIQKTDPLGHSNMYSYDEVGNLDSKTDANGVTTTFTYDNANHPTRIGYPNSTVQFGYDPAGRRTSMTDSLGTTIWNYDALNRPTSITDPFNRTVIYTYDPAGNETGLTYPDNKTVTYDYTASNQLSQVTDWNTHRTSYAYDAAGRLATVLRPNGVSSDYSYEPTGQLARIQHHSGLTTLASYDYSYDDAGNRVQVVEHIAQPFIPPTPTATISPTFTASATDTETFTASDTATSQSTETPTDTPIGTPTDTPTDVHGDYNPSGNVFLVNYNRLNQANIVQKSGEQHSLQEDLPTDTPTDAPTATPALTNTDTPTSAPIPSDTSLPTDTLTPTDAPLPTDTPAPSDTPTASNTPVPSSTPTATSTYTPSTTPTNPATPTLTSTATFTPTNTQTSTPTLTPTATQISVGPGTYDDTHPAWVYTGAWVSYTSSSTSPYSGSIHYTSTVGNSASITFNGARFILLYTVNTDRGNIDVWVDGTQITTINANGALLWQAAYSSPTFSSGTHIVSFKHAGPSGSYIDVDAITILDSAATSTPYPCSSWNVASDFHSAPNQENPNRDSCNNQGVWSFMRSSSLTRDPETYSLLTNFTSNYQGVSGLNWNGAPSGYPFVAFNATGSTYGGYWQANTVDVHPASNQMAIIAWRSPFNGHVSITGGVGDYDARCGDGILWYIDDNSTNLSAGWYSNGGSQSFANGTGGSHLSSVAVNTDDVIYFAVSPNQNNSCDSTRVDISIQAITQTPTPTATPTGGAYDLAQGKFASQSSDLVYYCNPAAGLAVDGNTDGNYSHCSVTSTNLDNQAWWQVDLGAITDISNINIWNRTDAGSEYLSNYYVLVSDAPFQSTDLNTTLNQGGVSVFYMPGAAGSPTTIPVNRTGRYVRIQLGGTNYLEMAELQIMGMIGMTATPTATANVTPTATSTPRPTPTATLMLTPPASSGPITVNYTYDPLNRLTAADYSMGDFYHYTYDPAGNRLTQINSVNNQPTTTNYGYDNANRLTSVNGTPYTWDNNGNLLNDGTSNYSYDIANRLIGVTQGSNNYIYAYDGLGDRVKQIVNSQITNYTLDLNTGLTQVLNDGTNTYTYGLDRISQQQGINAEYFLSDALGSVRQLADENGEITLGQSYDPYGNVISSVGDETSMYGYTGEQGDQTGLAYFRARYYDSYLGLFVQKDPMQDGNNWYSYARDNPINYTDPTGYVAWGEGNLLNSIHVQIEKYYEQYIPDGITRIHREYGRQRYSPTGNRSVDLIYFPYYNIQAGNQLFNFGGLTTGEVYEIEPITNTEYPHGSLQAARYAVMLTQLKDKLKGTVTDRNGTYTGFPYDWRYVTWDLGDSLPTTVFSLSNNIVFWKQRRGLIVYVDPKKDNQVRELMNNPAYANIRNTVAKLLPETVRDTYAEQLRSSATMCYDGLDPKYWDPNYNDPWWWWKQYWKARSECELNPNGVCHKVIGLWGS